MNPGNLQVDVFSMKSPDSPFIFKSDSERNKNLKYYKKVDLIFEEQGTC